jgi:DNA-binding NarL/FixJ family response regulator
MNEPLPHPGYSVVILKSDRFYGERLREVTLEVLPGAGVKLVTSVAEAAEMIGYEPADLLLTGAETTIAGNVVDFLADCAGQAEGVRHVLVVTTHSEIRLIAALRTLPVQGLFDAANDDPLNFITALRTVAAGGRYWSPNILRRFSDPGPVGPDALSRILTLFEQVVLSVVGGGCDDATAARELGLSPFTISTVRRHLHRKLGVQHRGELVRIAAQYGYVRFTPAGVVRPGFGMLAASYQAKKRKAGEDSR